jgi:hypothetical protein
MDHYKYDYEDEEEDDVDGKELACSYRYPY